jgi:ribosome-associated protein
MLRISPKLALDEDELHFDFVRASGPGGQNVNKVASAVQLRFDAARSPSLPDEVRARLRQIAGRRMTKDGWIVIEAQRFRSQERNREDAIERLIDLLREAEYRPAKRIKTRPSLGAKQRRLDAKGRRSETKKQRRAPVD